MKHLILIFISAYILSARLAAQVPEVVSGWPLSFQGGGPPAIAVVFASMTDQIENSSIYFGTNANQQYRYHFDALTWQGWPFEPDTFLYFGHNLDAIVDIDHDGLPETITFGRNGNIDGYLYVIDDDGSVMPGFPIFIARPSLNVADFDGDNEYEIMSMSYPEGFIYNFDRLGRIKEGWPIPIPPDPILASYNTASVGDIDLDGRSELVFKTQHNIFAYSPDGTQPLGFPITIFDSLFWYQNGSGWPPTLADIDGDGFSEIITGASNSDFHSPDYLTCLIVYDHTGNIKQGWPVFYNSIGLITSPAVVGDINGDGQTEIGFGYGDHVCFLNQSGIPLPGWPIQLLPIEGDPPGWWPQSDLTLVDINGDGNSEIFPDFNELYTDSLVDSIPYYGHGYFVGWNYLGQMLPGYPFQTRGTTAFRPPSFLYHDTDHSLYMGLSTLMNLVPIWPVDSLFLYLYRFPDSTGPPDQWPMRSHDNLQTRNYNFIDRVTSINDDNREILPKSYILKQNYPNPFNGNTLIEFVLPREEDVAISIYDILGRKVRDISKGRMTAGTHRETINMGDASSGVYFCILQGEKSRVSRKMMLLK